MPKSNWFDRFVGYFFPKAGYARARNRVALDLLDQYSRTYEGATKGRRTKGWKANSTSANTEVETSIVTLRNRARQLVRDNSYAAKGIEVISTGVLGGRGISTEIKVDTAQNRDSSRVSISKQRRNSQIWRAWAQTPACDYEGRHTFAGLQRLALRSVVESGEVLVRRRRSGERSVIGPDGIPVRVPPFQLQLLEGDFLDLNGFGSRAENGNTIYQGIEFDPNGKRVAYHLFKDHPGNSALGLTGNVASSFETIRVPADEIIHMYRADRPGQIRGVSWFSPIMIKLRDFDEYEDAQLLRQKIAACFAVFIKDLDGIDAITPPEEGELGEKVEPGIIEYLPPGKEIQLASPPTVEGYREYSSVTLHSIATGLGITYEALTSDLTEVNFSSARVGSLQMHKSFDSWREHMFIPQFMSKSFSWFAEGMDLMGEDISRMRPMWGTPRREMIDPQKEVNAQKDAVRSGFQTLSDVVRSYGQDPDRHFEEIQKDNSRLDDRGIIVDTDPRKDANRIPTTPQE